MDAGDLSLTATGVTPIITVSQIASKTDITLTVNGSFTDLTTTNRYLATIYWGDGTTSSVTVVPNGSGMSVLESAHLSGWSRSGLLAGRELTLTDTREGQPVH